MREIKFQLVWKHEDKIVKETVSLDYLLKNNPTAPRFTKGKLKVSAELVAKRQYTGLKDKNGVDIYEGDVLKCSYDYLWEVKWNSDYCGFLAGGEEISILRLDAEVIGNIHQNTELLEA